MRARGRVYTFKVEGHQASLVIPGPYRQSYIWEVPKTRGTLFWGPYNQDPTVRVLY